MTDAELEPDTARIEAARISLGPLVVRAGGPEDHPLVVDSWMRCAQISKLGIALGSQFGVEHESLISRVLAMPTALRVLAPADEPSAILGWACVVGVTLHYVFVKRDFRGLGLARMLLEDARIAVYTHRPVNMRDAKWAHEWIFNPYVFLRM